MYLIKLFERDYRNNGKEAIFKMTVTHNFPDYLKNLRLVWGEASLGKVFDTLAWSQIWAPRSYVKARCCSIHLYNPGPLWDNGSCRQGNPLQLDGLLCQSSMRRSPVSNKVKSKDWHLSLSSDLYTYTMVCVFLHSHIWTCVYTHIHISSKTQNKHHENLHKS